MTSCKPTCMAHTECHCESQCPSLLVFTAPPDTDTSGGKGSHTLYSLETGEARSKAHAQGRAESGRASAGGTVARAPAHLVGQSIGLPGRHLLLIVRIPKHAAQGGRMLQIEERAAVIMVPETRWGQGQLLRGFSQASQGHREDPVTY